jgi:hypothetical protein
LFLTWLAVCGAHAPYNGPARDFVHTFSVDRVWFGDGQAVAVNLDLDLEPAEDMRWVDPTPPAG